ncbi:MAG: bifunctional 2-polyprenyl-6-hydroxyphenol methylase/3-demethylubiquinol 3-O-methyltransferase UbiG [Gammaproteobacteria bacterium]|jgi:2-polyprenyl-6-hydroxyphenyl methylase/3-demethylubiquinone-9 3-methyltransferase|nr:bifunctional 2-polyprenyl-6-hydroxyphenol methylase/3-demethylubiquinol 3-O-methyltransferase UbiG [Gammaproteobacteria bacterium]
MTHTANIDPAEIKKFEDLASRWWDKQGEFKPLHEMNPLRLNFINTGSPLENKTVCDIGCGGGILSESMALYGATVTGSDMGKAPLSVARLHALESELDIDYRQITAEDMAEQEPATFDVITCMEMLEHVPDPASVISACFSLVKPGGSVYFSTINRNPKSYLFAIVGAEYVMKLLPRGTHDFAKFIKPSELDEWARLAGLELVNLKGISYNPFTSLFSQSQDVDVNYMVHYKRPADA